jgi:hypothetical protein
VKDRASDARGRFGPSTRPNRLPCDLRHWTGPACGGTGLKPNHRAPWTSEAIEELERLADHGLTAPEIAHRLRRTEGAIRRKALKVGVAVRRTPPSKTRPRAKPSTIADLGDDP